MVPLSPAYFSRNALHKFGSLYALVSNHLFVSAIRSDEQKERLRDQELRGTQGNNCSHVTGCEQETFTSLSLWGEPTCAHCSQNECGPSGV